MKPTLEDVLRTLARRGELNYLSLAFKDGAFHAAFVRTSRGQFHAHHIDPVQAIAAVLSQRGYVWDANPKSGKYQMPEKPWESDSDFG